MKTFKIYQHPVHGYEAVKQGFSWPAFFFGIFWMFFKKLWKYAGIWFGLYFVCALIESVADTSSDDGARSLVYLMLVAAYGVIWLLPAFKGNQWRVESLLRRGYELRSDVKAETPDAALAAANKMA